MGTDFVQGSRAHQAQARAHGQGHKASPDLFRWVSSPVRGKKSQFQNYQYSHKFPFYKKFLSTYLGRAYTATGGSFLWVFLIFSQIPILWKAFAFRGRAHPSNPSQSHIFIAYGACTIFDGVFYRGTVGATQMLNIHLRGRAGHTDFKIPVLSRMEMIAQPRSIHLSEFWNTFQSI